MQSPAGAAARAAAREDDDVPEQPRKTVLCFGDSLTWGWRPVERGVPSERYPREQRWTGVMAQALGDGYVVVEEGLNGRTTTADDPMDARLNGSAYLPAALASHLPLDLVVVMLGTNDTKATFGRSPFDIAVGAATLLGQVTASAGGIGTAYPAPRALLVAPPPLGEVTSPWFRALFDGAREKTLALPPLYAAAAAHHGAEFFDAGTATATTGVDGIHLAPADNEALGAALAARVREVLGG